MFVYIPECKYTINKLELQPEIISVIQEKIKIILINPKYFIIDFSIKLSIKYYNILYNSFGSSHKYYKLFILDTYFIELSSLLDFLIHNYF